MVAVFWLALSTLKAANETTEKMVTEIINSIKVNPGSERSHDAFRCLFVRFRFIAAPPLCSG
jgi:hypothetical protein